MEKEKRTDIATIVLYSVTTVRGVNISIAFQPQKGNLKNGIAVLRKNKDFCHFVYTMKLC